VPLEVITKAIPMRRDDVLVLQSPGGGGFGAPEERDPAAADADRRAGYTTARQGTPTSSTSQEHTTA
jgi:N-methylhydantoinase B/oxoprolinase/acetone carboxylase alpha subunit